MRTTVLFAALAATTALAAPAFAQDSDDRAFSGPRAEGVVGWDRIEDGAGADGDARDGVVYGGAIGYDFDTGSAVIGAEAELTGSTVKATETGIVGPGDSFKVSTGRDIYLGARVGFKAGRNALIYAKGGYTNTQIEARYAPAGGSVVEEHENADGWRLGAGAEVKLTDKVYLKGEYRYSNYSSIDSLDVDIDVDRHQVVGGVGIRF